MQVLGSTQEVQRELMITFQKWFRLKSAGQRGVGQFRNVACQLFDIMPARTFSSNFGKLSGASPTYKYRGGLVVVGSNWRRFAKF
jgi:hypothetical protein